MEVGLFLSAEMIGALLCGVWYKQMMALMAALLDMRLKIKG
jgi:hypothetical protein